MMMFVKLCVILGLMALAALALDRLFPAQKGAAGPRSLNDLMREVDIEDDCGVDKAAAGAEDGTQPAPEGALQQESGSQAEEKA